MDRILLVDDEESVRSAVSRRLTRDGYSVDEADNEVAAADMIRATEQSYDVVVTDMVMNSETAGMEVLKAALARDIFSEVIVLTAYGNVANAVECMQLGAFDYVEKNIPGVDVYDLLSIKVEQAVQRRRSSVNTIRRADQILRGLSGNK